MFTWIQGALGASTHIALALPTPQSPLAEKVGPLSQEIGAVALAKITNDPLPP